jgi:hypothetical protein
MNINEIMASCCIAKLRKRILGESQNYAKEVLNRIYINYWEFFKIGNLIGSWYLILIIDENTRYY